MYPGIYPGPDSRSDDTNERGADDDNRADAMRLGLSVAAAVSAVMLLICCVAIPLACFCTRATAARPCIGTNAWPACARALGLDGSTAEQEQNSGPAAVCYCVLATVLLPVLICWALVYAGDDEAKTTFGVYVAAIILVLLAGCALRACWFALARVSEDLRVRSENSRAVSSAQSTSTAGQFADKALGGCGTTPASTGTCCYAATIPCLGCIGFTAWVVFWVMDPDYTSDYFETAFRPSATNVSYIPGNGSCFIESGATPGNTTGCCAAYLTAAGLSDVGHYGNGYGGNESISTTHVFTRFLRDDTICGAAFVDCVGVPELVSVPLGPLASLCVSVVTYYLTPRVSRKSEVEADGDHGLVFNR